MGLEEAIYQRMPGAGRTLLMNLHAMRIHRHRYGRQLDCLANEFERLSTASRDEIESYQRQRLSSVLKQARDNVPYYRAIFGDSLDSDLAPKNSLEFLGVLPVLRKETLRAHAADLTSKGARSGWLHGHTSGTTGSPLSLWYSREMCYATNAADRLQKRVAGVADRAKVGMLLGRQVVPLANRNPPFWVENFVQRQVWYSSLHLSDETIPAYVQDMRRRRLAILEGYPSTLYLLAKCLVRSGQTLPMQVVFSSSETLHELQRSTIEEAFDCEVFDYYGHAERVAFAVECRAHVGKHLVEPFGITEVVDSEGNRMPDESPGFLAGTTLFNTAMPLLRYVTSDITALASGSCPCGLAFRKMKDVATKAEDTVLLPDGRYLSPSVLTHPFKPYPAIRSSQIIQESLHKVTVKLVAQDDFSPADELELASSLRSRLGGEVEIKIVRVSEIPRDRSGKYRWVISHVPSDAKVSWQ